MQCIYGFIPGTQREGANEESKAKYETVFAQEDFVNMLRRILIDGLVREGSMNVLSH